MSDDLTHCPCCHGEGYFYGDERPPQPWGDAYELTRLHADIERLTTSLAAEVEESERLRGALAGERRHGDELAAVLEQCARGLSGMAGRQALAALIRHRTRRQG